MKLRTILPALLICALIGFGMWYCFPQYDDTLIELVRSQNDSSVLSTMHKDRPARGWILEQFDRHEILWTGMAVVNVLGWCAFAVLAARVASIFFPRQPEIAMASGLLATAPILSELQFVILNSMIDILGVAAVGLLFCLHPYRSPILRAAACGLTALIFFAGAAVAEYVTAMAGASGFLLFMLGEASSQASYRRQLRIAACLILVAGLAGYITLSLTKDSGFRPAANVEDLFSDGPLRAVKLPFRLVTALYQAGGGAFLRELGDLTIGNKEAIAATMFGGALAVLSVWLAKAGNHEDTAGRPSNQAFALLTCAGSVALGLLPFLLMGRRTTDTDFNSRFFDPALPFAAVLMATVFLSFLTWRGRLAGLAIIAFVAGYTTIDKMLVLHSDVAILETWGREIRKHLAPHGTTIAIVPVSPTPRQLIHDDDDLTVMLSRHWSPQERRRFWARRDPSTLGPASSSVMRGGQIESPVERVLLIQPNFDGSTLTIHALMGPFEAQNAGP